MIANYVNTFMWTKCQRTMNIASHLRWHLFGKIAEILFAEILNSRLVDRVLVCHYISIGIIGVKHCYFVIWLRSVMSGSERKKEYGLKISRCVTVWIRLSSPHPFIWLPAPVPFMRFEIWLWCECYAVAVSYGCILCIELELIGRKSHNLN